ncbi:MAG TPA: phospholipase D family protein [Variovorax sp.]|nr:phospholipase D family protein [Variovorax sp.]
MLRILLASAALALAGCASLPPFDAQPPSSAPTAAAVAQTPLARIARADQTETPGLSGFRLLPQGATAFQARLALARRALVSIDAQYYILQRDASGLALLRALREAAARGVRVRLLVDGLYAPVNEDLYAALAALPNFEVRQFNPLPARSGPLPWRLMRSLHEAAGINRRMHNKLFVADNSLAITGGRNIADEYFMLGGTANFVDMDLLVSGQAVGELSQSFDEYWNSAEVRPMAGLQPVPAAGEAARRLDAAFAPLPADMYEPGLDVLGQPSVAAQLEQGWLTQVWADSRVLADFHGKIRQDDPEASLADSVTQRTLSQVQGARSEVFVVSPYFVPGERGLELVEDATRRGARLVVLTNALNATDETLVYGGYSRYRERLLKAGVRVYELGADLVTRDRRLGNFKSSTGRLHAKVAVIDGRRVFIGSMNFDGRSAWLNTEVGLIVDSTELASQFRELIDERGPGAYELRLDTDGTMLWVERDSDGAETVRREEPGWNPFYRFRDWLLLQVVPEEML